MLSFSQIQKTAFGALSRDIFIDNLCVQFAAIFSTQSDAALRVEIVQCIERAAPFGFHTRQDVARFVNLSGRFGWGFERNPKLRWMRAMLLDKSVSRPSDRLTLLIEECLHREEVEAHNQKLRASFYKSRDNLDDLAPPPPEMPQTDDVEDAAL
ncbi:MAG: hypothetical protein AB8B51_12940 [Sedimentitalea sp.]